MRREPTTPVLLLGLSFLGFVSLGLPDGVLGVAWPSIRASFALPLDALGALLVSATAGYVLSSFASGWLLARLSVGALLAWSCLLTAASLLGYAVAPAWAAMVALGTLAGLGAGAIDAGLNTYVATHHSARTLSLLHACYGLGTSTGPLIMTGVLMAGGPWQRGYAIVGGAQVALAAAFATSRGRWPRPHGAPAAIAAAGSGAAPRDAAAVTAAAGFGATIRLPAAQLGVAAFFLYVGLEAIAGAWLFSLLHVGRGVPMAGAGVAVSVFWGGLTAGRLIFGLGPGGSRPGAALRLCIPGTALGGLLLALGLGRPADLGAAAFLGCAAGPIFPALIATTPARLGPSHTANAVGFQVAAAAVGQSLLPALTGVAADAAGLHVVPLVLVGLAIALGVVHHLLERAAPIDRARAAASASSPAPRSEVAPDYGR